MIRPYSELKASTPVDKPPLPSQSAPPQLAEQAKIDGKFKTLRITIVN